MKKRVYIALITYSFDSDYIIKPFYEEKEALKQLNTWLDDEVQTVIMEHEYEPTIISYSEDDKVLIYAKNETEEEKPDKAYYRVICTDIEPSVDAVEKGKTSEITKILLTGIANLNQR